MSDIEASVEKYVASWAEPDAELRRKTIAELWVTDAVYKNQIAEYLGLEGIEEAVTEAYDMFATKGYRFNVARVDINHDVVRYVWEMLPPDGDTPEAIGTQVVIVNADGRMVRDHQFVDKAPEGMEELLGISTDA